MTLCYYDSVFLEHDTGEHPERAGRLIPATRSLPRWTDELQLTRPTWPAASVDDVCRVHRRGYVDRVRQFAAEGGGPIEADTVVSERSYEVALKAVGAVGDAVRRVIAGEDRRAFCLLRPPGHHALNNAPMGFCLFNSIAIGARLAIDTHGLERVLIVDWDVHHGNGTQAAFWEDPQVGFYSIHRWPFYPGTGDADETGAGDGRGTTLNVPVRFGTSRQAYRSQFEATVNEFADKLRPQLVLISAGFDSHRNDPIGSLGLDSEDFQPLTEVVTAIAERYAQGRVVSVLEGGYNPHALEESLQVHLRALHCD
jgi:acetoin utilization deacetylase AcuC-like enzyme